MAGFDPKAYAAGADAPEAPAAPAFDPKAYAAGASAPEPEGSGLKAFATHALDAMSAGLRNAYARPELAGSEPPDDLERRERGEAALKSELATEAHDSPKASGLGDLAGGLLHPTNVLLSGAGGTASKAATSAIDSTALPAFAKWALGRAARGAVGGVTGTALGAANAMAHGEGPGEGAKAGGTLGAAGGVSPGLTSAGLLAAGLENDDPALALAGGLGVGSTALGLASRGLGAALGSRAQSVRDQVAEPMVKGANRAEQRRLLDYSKLLRRSTEDIPDALGTANEAEQQRLLGEAKRLGASEKLPSPGPDEALATQKQRLLDEAKRYGASEKLPAPQDPLAAEKQRLLDEAKRYGVSEKLPSPGPDEAVKAERQRRIDYARTLRNATEPVARPGGGGTTLPADLGASAQGTMAKEIQDSYALARARHDLGLTLDERAQRGLANLTPDYQTRINVELGKYAEGKDVRFAQILKNLEANQSPVPPASPREYQPPLGFKDARLQEGPASLKPNPLAGMTEPPRMPAVLGLPDARGLDTSAALKPNPLAGLKVPEPLPPRLGLPDARGLDTSAALKPNPLAGLKPPAPLPAGLGLPDARGLRAPATLKPNPLAGFVPKVAPPSPFPDARLQEGPASLKPNPLAGYTPGTAASMRDRLAPQVDAKIADLAAQQGPAARLGAGAVKGMSGLPAAVLYSGIGTPAALPMAALGAGKALFSDPVLVQRWLAPTGAAAQRLGARAPAIARFLTTNDPGVLGARVQFLMRNDPEFAAAVAAQGDESGE